MARGCVVIQYRVMLSRPPSHNHPLLSCVSIIWLQPASIFNHGPLWGTAGVTAIALTLTSAAPVQARGLSEDDIGKILFGLVAAGVLSQALQNHQKPRQAAPVPQNYTQRAPAPNTRSQSDPRHRGVAILPRQCLQNVETRFGTHRIFARRCLQRNDVNDHP